MPTPLRPGRSLRPDLGRSPRPDLGRCLAAAATLALGLVAVTTLAACDAFTPQKPSPTPTDFAGIVAELARGGIAVDHVTEGDAGCPDQRLARTAVGFDATGIDQPTATRVYLYAFKDSATFDQLRPSVDSCARSYVTDPTAYATIESSPYLFAGAGPWAPGFKDALRQALMRAAVGG